MPQPLDVMAVQAQLESISFLFLSIFYTIISTIFMAGYHYYQETKPSFKFHVHCPIIGWLVLKNQRDNRIKNILWLYLSIERKIKDDLKIKDEVDGCISYAAKEMVNGRFHHLA